MRRSFVLGAVVVLGVVTVAIGQVPQGGPPPAAMTIDLVKPGLYAILNPGSNTLAVRVTNDGVLLVDDMFERHYDQIIALVKRVTSQPVKYVVSTHHHGDHTGGNIRFLQSATIVGHKNARAAMMRATPQMPGPPPVTYTTEAAIHLGNVEVQLHHVGAGHTNGDTIVYFPDLRVVATGDLFTVTGQIPPIDYANGGTALAWPATLDRVLQFDFDTVIPGHGPVSTRPDVQRHKEKLQILQTRTRELIKQGVPKTEYLGRLKIDDLGFKVGPDSNFARNAAGLFYDELAQNMR